MLNTTGFSISFIPGYKTVYRNNFPHKNLTIDIISGEGYSYPEDSSIEINSYIYISFTVIFLKERKDITVKEFLSIVNNKEVDRLFSNSAPNQFVLNLQFTPKSIETMINVLKQQDMNSDDPKPCCKCGLMDHWNSKNNNQWYCYQHCSF